MLVVTTNALVCQVNVDVDYMFISLKKYIFFHVASKFLLLFIINLRTRFICCVAVKQGEFFSVLIFF
jgi:hypothetical protein